ncbi:MAG TPA: hypothetical protein VGC16_04080 [Rhizomicrobium sp.]
MTGATSTKRNGAPHINHAVALVSGTRFVTPVLVWQLIGRDFRAQRRFPNLFPPFSPQPHNSLNPEE